MSRTIDELSTRNPLAEQLPPLHQTELERAKTVNNTKMSQMQIQDLKTMHGQVLNDLSRMTLRTCTCQARVLGLGRIRKGVECTLDFKRGAGSKSNEQQRL